MSSLWTNLLFLHGHISDPALARRLAEAPKPGPRPGGKRRRVPTVQANTHKAAPPAVLAQGGCA
ncbi:hypothetical protein [Dyella sedimenti]|uniref:hypothetical protein n=1 Tax=Dyella sedimenti TaxID=2919947 RepID=UPI001FAAF2AD|nr:hypothetical protein [Dyella sedimenti]